jgi:hypothetical protein
MLDAIAGIEATVAGASFAEYARNWTMRRAVERGIEIISEASRHLPEELKASSLRSAGARSRRSTTCSGTNTAGSTTGSSGAWWRSTCPS